MTSPVTPAFLPLPAFPSSPIRVPRLSPPVCSNKRHKPRPHPPPRVRPSPSPRILAQICRGEGEQAESVTKILKSRRDAVIIGRGFRGKISAALAAREASEETLVLVGTREEAEIAAAEAALEVGDAKVVIASGQGGLSWAHAGAIANASVKPVIVVGTVRGMESRFVRDGHGSKWLKKVRYVIVAGVERIMKVDGGKGLGMWRVLNAIRQKDVRKNCVMIEESFEKVLELVRKKHETVQWDLGGEKPEVRVVVCENWGGVWEAVREMLGAGQVFLCQTGRLAEVYASLAREEGWEVEVGRRQGGLRRGKDQAWEESGMLFASGGVREVEKVVQIGFVGEGWSERGARQNVLVVAKEEMAWVKACVGEGVAIEHRGGGEVAQRVDERVAEKGYASLLGFYMHGRRKLGWEKEDVVGCVNEWARQVLGQVPELEKKAVDRVWLRGVAGVKVKQVVNV